MSKNETQAEVQETAPPEETAKASPILDLRSAEPDGPDAAAKVNEMLVEQRDSGLAQIQFLNKQLHQMRLELTAFQRRAQKLTDEVLTLEFQKAELEEEVKILKGPAAFQEA